VPTSSSRRSSRTWRSSGSCSRGSRRPSADDAVLATNTSSLSVTEIAAPLRRPERVCGLHFFNPVPLMKLVEVVPGERTDAGVVTRLDELVRRVGHTSVRVVDSPGFLVNHAGRAYSTEALRLLDEGVAEPADIDRVLRDSAGFRMGPFELFDLTGLDVSQPVMETVWAGFYGDPRLRPSPTGRRRMAAQRLGRKTGEGFYAYTGEGSGRPDEPPPPAYDATPVWVGDDAAALRDRLRAAAVSVEDGPEPSASAVALVAPWGDDVTTTVLGRGLPVQRTLGVDPFGGFAGRLTLATSPGTAADAVTAAHAALASTGAPVTVIRDSPGFVAQRVVAAVVNLGCEIAQLGLAAPQDIDTAVRMALGYPRGPLTWGDELGPATVLRVLDGLWDATRDPRYRPSPWLSRRARLGVSLLTVERGGPAAAGPVPSTV
jgi:3-hydroxybutyryl-CoA dehydrogenase